ncbi:endo-1,4-beta-xylanase [Paenibacillus sp. CCS19]|uniref:alpha/beta hydrolase n=1 Tax=Paenibacillus sp. CCS19 TaxID=3158387 RepID=UPI002568B51A|nr:alpha/beta hydrolase-fold protein [Paenibacillus cellulosilyticus]GMK37690.1 endo-1,4-beta-xylanase [Paenibacillus cellulosilyticus]
MKYVVSLALFAAICLLILAFYPESSTPQSEAPASAGSSTNAPEPASIPSEQKQSSLSSTVERIRMDSKLLGQEMHASVYLPPGYSTDAQYPVLYLFHGYGGSYGDYAAYLSLQSVMDRLIQSDLIEPLIIVEPEYRNSFGVNSKPGEGQDPGSVSIGPYEDYLMQEVIPYIDTHYSTQASRASRSIGGISMGGYASLYLGLNHHDLFSKIGAHSAALWNYTSSDQFTDQRDWLYANDALRSLRDPFKLAEDPSRLQDMKIYLDAGANDQLSVQDYAFYELLQEQNADVVWSSTPGGHNGAYWGGMLEKYLLFYAGISGDSE